MSKSCLDGNHATKESSMNSQDIANTSNNRNVETRKPDRTEYAAGIARLEFGGRNYPAEGYDGFVDRPPGLIAALRVERWPGAVR